MSDRLKESSYKRGPKQSSKPAPSKWSRAQGTEIRGSLSWNDAGPEDLLAAIAAATEDGAAVLLSKTSDGGALVVRILTDSGSTPFYPASMSALSEVLSLIVEVAGKA